MEKSFGTDFSGVNIHKNSSSADDLDARAYTQGNNIHFAPGEYNPHSKEGQKLIGHELSHVVQQRQGRVQPTTIKKGKYINDNSELEREADLHGDKSANGEIIFENLKHNKNLNNESAQLKSHGEDCSCEECSGAQLKVKAGMENIQLKSHGDSCGCEECSGIQLKEKTNTSFSNFSSSVVQKTDKSPFDVKGEQKLWYGNKKDTGILYKTPESTFVTIFKGVVPKGGVAKLDKAQKYAASTEKIAENTTLYAIESADNLKVLKTVSGAEMYLSAALFMSPIKIGVDERIEVTGNIEKKGEIQYDEVIISGLKLWVDHARLKFVNFDLTYATKVSKENEKAILSPRKGSDASDNQYRIKVRNIYSQSVKNAYLSGTAMRDISIVVPKINSSKAAIGTFDEKTKIYTKGENVFAQGAYAAILEEVLVEKEGKGTWYGKVRDTKGNEGWTWLGQTPRKEKGIGVTYGNIAFAKFQRFDEIEDSTVREKLAAEHTKKINDLIGEKAGFSAMQKTLLSEASTFASDSKLKEGIKGNVIYPSDSDGSNLILDGNSLSTVLMDRLDIFYKFLLHKGLIFGNKDQNFAASDGMRPPRKAHILSTSYSTYKGKIPFENFDALKDGKDLDGNLWYDKEKDTVYERVPLEEKELEEEKATAIKEKRNPILTKATKNIDKAETLKNITKRVLAIKIQKAEAADGYKLGSDKRKPNTHMGTSNHCIGEAVDVHFKFKFNVYDPIIDAIAAYFGLSRVQKESGESPEDWHYERMGIVHNKK
jgi:hypothetical protein